MELSLDRQSDELISDLTSEELQIFSDWAIQEMIAAIFLSLKEAKELSVKFRPITSLELFVQDGRLVFKILFTAIDGRSTITLFTGLKLDELNEILRCLWIEASAKS